MAGRISYTGGIVRNGLVLYLDAAKRDSYPKTGTIWTDISGNGNNGTLANGPTYNSVNGGTIVFDGTNDNIQLGNVSNIFSSQSQITVNSWIKTNVVGSYRKIITNSTAGGGGANITGMYLSLGPIADGAVYFGILTNTGANYATYKTAYLSTTRYYNVCGTWDGTTIKLYLDGALVASQSHTGTISNTGILRISGYDNNNETFNGNIPVVNLYNRALSAIEILQNYNALKNRYI